MKINKLLNINSVLSESELELENSILTDENEKSMNYFSDEIIHAKKYFKNNKLSKLEYYAIANNLQKIENCIKEGHTLFDLNNNKICNGYYERNNLVHPNKCTKICFKIALYYALINNCRIYKTIYFVIKKMLDLKMNINQNILTYLSEIVNNLSTISCTCSESELYCKGYKETFLNFKQVNYFIKDKINYIKNNFYCEIHKINFILLPLNFCIHEKLTKEIFIYDNSDYIHILLNLFDMYNINVNICTLLFNQQMFELFHHALNNSQNEDALIIIFKKFIRNDNPHININYVNNYSGHSIFSLTVVKNDYPNLIKSMLQNNAYNKEYNLVLLAFSNKFYNTGEILLDYIENPSEKHKLYNNIIEILLEDNNLNYTRKIELFNKIIPDFSQINITTLLNKIYNLDDFFYQLYKIISNKNIIGNEIKLELIKKSIIQNNAIVLDILIDNYDDIISVIDFYFNIINYDDQKINILYSLLNKNINLNYIKNGVSPLIITIQKNCEKCFNTVLEYCDITLLDDNNKSCLIYAIQNENISIVKQLCTKYLINLPDIKNIYPIDYSLKCDNLDIFYLLINHPDIDISLNIQIFFLIIEEEKINNINKIKLLQKYDKVIDYNILNKYNKTILLVALELSNYEIARFIFEKLIENKIIITTITNNKNELFTKPLTMYTTAHINYYQYVYNQLINTNLSENYKANNNKNSYLYMLFFLCISMVIHIFILYKNEQKQYITDIFIQIDNTENNENTEDINYILNTVEIFTEVSNFI